MVTRRVHKRQMLLLDDDEVDRIIEYTLAYCPHKYDLELHAIVVEGNHIHRVDTDPLGERPDFIRDFHALLARQLNVYYGEADAFFSNKQTSIVDCEAAHDVLKRIVYTMGNPVADGIERHGANHRGIRMRWPQPPRVIQRPRRFWRSIEDGGVAPNELTLRFTRPPGFDGLTDEELDTLLEGRILAYEKDQRDHRDREGRPFLCDQPEGKRPKAGCFPSSPHRLFELSPLIGAALEKHRRDAIRRLRQFRHDHEEARLRVLAGDTDVVFPYGTFQAVRRWGCAAAPAPT